MIPHSTDLVASASSQLPSEFFCPPIQTWVLSDTTVFKITAVATTIIWPVTILLNILVILALKNRTVLQKNNSNILLTSMALADVLLGAVSVPLTIISDVLVLAKFLNVSVFCGIAFVNDTILYIGSCSSVNHLTVIAWERYVAIEKWENYKVIVTRGRVKMLARIAWLSAVLTPVPPTIMKITGVEYKYLLAVDIACVLPGTVCLMLIGYFYIRVYLSVRKQETEKIRNVGFLVKAKLATKVAKTTAILTVLALISFVPSLVFLLFGEIFAALRRSSYFRWSMMLAQLNSVFNPVLYCCRDRRFRDAFLEMLKMKPEARVQSNNRRIGPAQSLDDLQRIDVAPRSRSRSLADLAGKAGGRSGGQEGRHRLKSFPIPSTNVTICVDVCQPKIITTAPGMIRGSHWHVKATSGQRQASFRASSRASLQTEAWSLQSAQGSRHHLREKIRSKSLDEHLFVEKIGSQHKSTRSGKKT